MSAIQAHAPADFARLKSSCDAYVHVMSRHAVDPWMHQPAKDVGQAGAIGFGKNQYIEVMDPVSQMYQGFTFEVMEKQIRDQNATRPWGIRCKNVTLIPHHPRFQGGRPRREIISRDGGLWKPPCKLPAQDPVTRTDFHDAPGGAFSIFIDCPAYPTLVAHEEIDASQVAAAAQRFGIIRRKMVENFWNDDALAHWQQISQLAHWVKLFH